MSKIKLRIYWAGFSDGKFHRWPDGELNIYSSRKKARRCYQDVRPVKIIEVKK